MVRALHFCLSWLFLFPAFLFRRADGEPGWSIAVRKTIMFPFVFRPAMAAGKPSALALAVASLFSLPATAQAAPEEALTPVIVTATRTPARASDILSDTVVITAQDIAQSGQTSLVGLLQQQRGIEITMTGGPGTSSSVFLRGADNKQSIVLIDGVRIGSSTLGGATWSSIPLPQIDHIEIVYGPLSSLYGADAIGGVVQIFTRKGEGAPRMTASAGYGSYATRTLDASLSGATGVDHILRDAISAAHEASDGFSATKPGNFSFNPDKDGYKRDSASGQFGYVLAKDQEVGFNFLQSRLNAQFDSGPSAYDARSIQKLDNYALYAKNRLSSNWTSTLQLSRTADRSGTDTSAAASGKSQIDTTQTDLSWQNDVLLGPDVLQLLAERRKEQVDASSTPALTGERVTNSVAASYQLKRQAHLATASLRNDNSSQFGSHTTGAVGYGYWITNALRANASAGTSFRAPTFNELYFPGFGVATNKPEKGRNTEAGLYYDDGRTQASAVYYHNRITDLLVTAAVCPVDPAAHPFGCAYNVDRALLTGITLGASTRLGKVTLRGSLDLQDPRDETTDQLLVRRARQHATVALAYKVGAVQTGMELLMSGKRYDDVANRNVLGGYGLLNLYANYDVAPNWSLFARWNNVTSKNYELARNYATAGSNVFVGIRYAMK
jgi:vitamin B12 transporter